MITTAIIITLIIETLIFITIIIDFNVIRERYKNTKLLLEKGINKGVFVLNNRIWTILRKILRLEDLRGK
jgi:hypothetical protein